MAILACPTDVVAAAPEQIWEQLVRPELLAAWTRIPLAKAPERALAPGDRVVFRRGPLPIVFDILAADEPRELTMDVQLPFGVVNHEVIRILDVGDRRSRVTLN